jgi:hypothetical protein
MPTSVHALLVPDDACPTSGQSITQGGPGRPLRLAATGAHQQMPFYKLILSGRGIDLIVGDDRVVGFYTTRLVHARDLRSAELKASELVMSEWRAGGKYYATNRGALPVLAVEQAFEAGPIAVIFGRRPRGYSFYCAED